MTKQLVCQLLHLNLALALEVLELFNPRAFRRMDSFVSAFQLLNNIIAIIDFLLILVDRIDLYERSPDSVREQGIVRALPNRGGIQRH